MFRRKDPPLPRLDESPPAELESRGPKSALAIWGWRIGVALTMAAVGAAFGVWGVLVVSVCCTFRFLRSFYFVLRGDFGSDGWNLVLEMETFPITLYVLLPAWLGYAVAGLLSL
jgi:hypothetical protein